MAAPAGFAVAAGLLAAPSSPHETPPSNVLVIVMDDVGVDLVGCYDVYFRSRGVPATTPAATPAIDTLLAARGVTFANAWTPPACTPSRAQILTGRFASRNGQGAALKYAAQSLFRSPGLPADASILPETLRAAPQPYVSVALGKWHLADRGQVDALTHPLGEPLGRWFDRYAGSLTNLRRPAISSGGSVYEDWRKAYASELEPGVNPCPGGPVPCEVAMVSPPVENYATVDTADDALAMLALLPEPWFLYVAFDAVHAPPHDVPAGTPSTACGGYVSAPPCSAPASDAPGRTRCMMQELDTQIGRILCSVDEADTTVILIGDNGTKSNAVVAPYVSNHSKGTMYQGGIRVPLIVRSPLVAPGQAGTVSEGLVCSTDLFATIAQLAGATAALSSARTGEDSVSLVPYLTGAAQGSLRDLAYAEEFVPSFVPDPIVGGPPASYVGQRHAQAIRNARFKLIRWTERDRLDPSLIFVEEKFFDLEQGGPPDTSGGAPIPTPDWFEQNDLLAPSQPPLTGAAAAAHAHLSARLDAFHPALVR